MTLWAVFAALIVIWLLGLLAQLGGSLINLLLVAAAVVVVVQYARDTPRP